jgi:hypothetical protein
MAISASGDVVDELFGDPLSVSPRQNGATDFKPRRRWPATYQHLRLVA